MLIAKAESKYAIDIFKRALTKSEPVIFSTDTIYGIGAPLSDIEANRRIFEIKGRDRTKPFPVLAYSIEQLQEIALIETDMQQRITNKLWPGPFTLILKAKKGLGSLFTINGTVAVRLPATVWLRNVLKETGPLSATSANLSGISYAGEEKSILSLFANSINFYIFDNNKEKNSSAIIDISGETFKVIRPSENLPDLSSL